MNLTREGILKHPEISEVGIVDGLDTWLLFDGSYEDISGNARATSIAGSTVALANGNGQRCYKFDGTAGNYIQANTSVLSPTSWTISAWLLKSAHSVTSYPIFVSFSLPYISCDGSTSPFRVSYTAASGQNNAGGVLVPVLDQWYHVVATSSTDGVRLYVNGAFEKLNANVCTAVSVSYFEVGRHLNSDTYAINGRVQDVRIYNRPLSAEEIGILYDLRKKNPAPMRVTQDTIYLSGRYKEE